VGEKHIHRFLKSKYDYTLDLLVFQLRLQRSNLNVNFKQAIYSPQELSMQQKKMAVNSTNSRSDMNYRGQTGTISVGGGQTSVGN